MRVHIDFLFIQVATNKNCIIAGMTCRPRPGTDDIVYDHRMVLQQPADRKASICKDSNLIMFMYETSGSVQFYVD